MASGKKAPDYKTLAENLAKALEWYAKGYHFEYGGDPSHEGAPESVSGEPLNFLCGGTEGQEYTYEDGAIARHHLEAYKKALEGK